MSPEQWACVLLNLLRSDERLCNIGHVGSSTGTPLSQSYKYNLSHNGGVRKILPCSVLTCSLEGAAMVTEEIQLEYQEYQGRGSVEMTILQFILI